MPRTPLVLLVTAFAISIGTTRAADAPPQTPPAKEAPKPAAPAANKPGPEAASGLDVSVKSAKVDYVALKKPIAGGGFEELVSGQKVLAITLTLTNKGEKEIAYKSFNGTLDGKDDRASLLTTTKKFLPLVNFGELEPADAIKQATLKPGDAVTDTLYFMAPPANIVPETLMLPAKNHGDSGYWRVPVKIEEDK
ncbi:MAG TPA: hypothetical protein VEA69_18385 [Tepidisphaeraceae bacterium]|nr:hypothetical protein [Tepidisphaeraceae bacterium]